MHITDDPANEVSCTPQTPALEWTSQTSGEDSLPQAEEPECAPQPEAAAPDASIKPTRETYDPLQQAFERLNRDLFDGELPNALITLQRRNRTFGYFSGGQFARDDGRTCDEIALNPAHFRDRGVEEVLATLAHEMVHLWQHHHGAPGRGRYHNREWAAKMKAVGLHPSDTGAEGGKETGERVHHFIVPGGPFDRAVRKLLARGFTITWTEKPPSTPAVEGEGGDGNEAAGSKSGKRVRYDCTHEECKARLWGQDGLEPICGGRVKEVRFHEEPLPMEPAA